MSIFIFTGTSNELLLALALITSESRRPAPLALNDLISSDILPWALPARNQFPRRRPL